MENTRELCEVQINQEGTAPKKERIRRYDVLIRVIGLLLARGTAFYVLAPFGVSYMAMERRFSKKALISCLMVCAGYLSLFDINISGKYIFATIAYMAFLFVADRGDCDIPDYVCIAAAGVVTALGRLCSMIWTGFSLGEWIWIVCDTALAVVGAFVFEKNKIILNGQKNPIFSMNKEEKVCFYVLTAIMLLGLKSISLDGFVTVANIVGIWATVVFAMCGGIGIGAVCGTVIGGILGAENDMAVYMSIFAVGGIVCGMLSKYGKTAGVLAMSAVVIGGCVFFGERTEVIGYLDIPLSVILTIFTSESLIRRIGRIGGLTTDNSDSERLKEYIKTRLNTAASSFRILAETFLDLSDKQNTVDMEDVSMMFDRTADRVCRECSRMSECWVNNFNNTYKSLFHMLEVMERKGELTESDADEYFSKKCLRLRGIVKEMNRLFEIYKINCVWKSKLQENRELAGEQLGSVAQILDSIADEMYEERIDSSSEEEIRIRLEDKGVRVVSLSAAINVKGRLSVYIEVEENTSLDECRRASETALKAVLGTRLVMNGIVRKESGEIMLRFSQPEGYMVETGIAGKSADDENGDNCVVRYLSDGKFAAALSDGMGTGHKASRDSGATVRLLGDFLEAGFDKTVAVRLINSIMVMKSANEAFATVDMCVIDLFSGEAEFIKNGAEPSYIKRQGGVETIRAASLPVGVIQGVEIDSFAYNLEENDIVVLLSDGLQMKKGYENWIKSAVEEANREMPAQELADRIIDMAKALHGENSDDMTVAVLKLRQR